MQDSTSSPRKKRKRVLHLAPVIAERDIGWICLYCGIALVPYKAPYTDQRYYIPAEPGIVTIRDGYALCSVDHAVPVCKGGGDELDNLVLCCEVCNMTKGGKDISDFVFWNTTHPTKHRKVRYITTDER